MPATAAIATPARRCEREPTNLSLNLAIRSSLVLARPVSLRASVATDVGGFASPHAHRPGSRTCSNPPSRFTGRAGGRVANCGGRQFTSSIYRAPPAGPLPSLVVARTPYTEYKECQSRLIGERSAGRSICRGDAFVQPKKSPRALDYRPVDHAPAVADGAGTCRNPGLELGDELARRGDLLATGRELLVQGLDLRGVDAQAAGKSELPRLADHRAKGAEIVELGHRPEIAERQLAGG